MGMNFKRFLSLLLAFVMVLGMFPMGHAHAAEVNRVAYAKVRNGNRLVSLNDCLYTFSQQENGTWLISAQVGETTVHVDPHGGSGNAGKPSRDYKTFITLKDGYTDDAVKFFEENGGYLHVHTEKAASAANWNQCTGDHTDSNAHDVFLYRPVGENEASSQEIPGYVLAEVVVSDEGVTGISSGDRLLIVGKHNDDSISVLHPSTSTNNGDDHIAVLEIVEEVENLGLTVTARFTSNRLSWNASPNTSYNVERSADNVAWEQIATVTTGAYLDETAGQGTQYFYRVSDGTETTNGVQGHVTGMAALKEVAVLVYEGDGTVFNGSNKVAIAEGEKASELNALHSGTIIYKAYFANENGLSGKQAVLGTDTGLFVGFDGEKFRHELGAGFSGGPSVSNLKNNASNTGAFSYDDTKNTGNWILVSNGADATVVNLDNSKFSLLGNTGATTYYAGGSSAQSFNGTINYILVLSEVLSGNELKTLTGLNLNHNEEQHTWANATCTAPKTCSVCGLTEGEANGHTYTNDYDSTCNICGEPREGVQEFDSEKLTITDWEASQHDTTEVAYKKLPEYAFDGKYCTAEDYTSFWATVEDGNIADQYLIAKLGEALLVNQVKITQRWYPSAGYNCTGKLLNYFIWVKTDADTDWTCVAEGNTVDGTTTVTFEYPVVATQIKLTSTSSQGNKVMNVAEFEIFKAVCKNGEHTPNEDDGDCTSAITCSICGTVTTSGAEEHVYNSCEDTKCANCNVTREAQAHDYDDGEVTTEPTLEAEGEMTYTCSVCGGTKTEPIAKLEPGLSVQPLMDGWTHGTVSLADCEFSIVKNTNSTNFSVSHGGYYYVNLGNKGDTWPMQADVHNAVSLYNKSSEGKIQIGGNGFLYMDYNNGNPVWAKSGTTNAFYLLKANPDSEFAGIPGYEVVTSKYDIKDDTSYLIAANFDDEWFVMYPAFGTTSIAKVVDVAATHEHDYEVVAGAEGKKTEECACGHVHVSDAPQHTHNLTHVAAKDRTCTEDGNIEYWYCADCGGYWTDEACTTTTTLTAVTIPADGHMYDANVTAPTCTEKGYTTYTCSKCNYAYTSAEVAAKGHGPITYMEAKPATCAETGNVEHWYCKTCKKNWSNAECTTEIENVTIPATGEHTYDNDQDTDCNVCGDIRLLNGYMTSMTMANSLNMNFCFEQDLVEDWTDCYAVLVKEDGAKQTVSRDAWKTITVDGVACYYATYTNLAAKEMTDKITVTVYNADNQVIAGPFTDTVRDHAIRNLQKTQSEQNKTMVMDMLNYGAAAQLKAGYKTDTLANEGDELNAYRDFATKSVVYTNEMANSSNTIKYLANVRMVDNLKFMMAFYGVDETMSLRISYKHWNSKEDEIVVKNFAVKELEKSGSYHVVILDDTVVADARQVITVEVLDAEGAVVATIIDSIASYAARARGTADSLYDAIMKFATSAKVYLENK